MFLALSNSPAVTHENILFNIKETANRVSIGLSGPVQLIGLLKGAVPFLTYFSQHFPTPHSINYLSVNGEGKKNAFPDSARVTEPPNFFLDPNLPTFVLDDIYETGFTARTVSRFLQEKGIPLSKLHYIALLRRSGAFMSKELKTYYTTSYACIILSTLNFVVGFGLDHNEYYRNLPNIYYRLEDLEGGKEATS